MTGTGGPSGASTAARSASLLFRLILFINSYAPLAIIFAVQCETTTAMISWLSLGVLAMSLGLFMIVSQLGKVGVPVTVSQVDDRGGEVAGYLATYLLPFLSGPPSSLSQVVAYVTYFLVAAVVAVQSRVILVNPTLYIFGWKVAQLEIAGASRLVVCRKLPLKGQSIEVVTFLDAMIRKR